MSSIIMSIHQNILCICSEVKAKQESVFVSSRTEEGRKPVLFWQSREKETNKEGEKETNEEAVQIGTDIIRIHTSQGKREASC